MIGDPVVFLTNAVGVGFVVKGRGTEDGEIDVAEGLSARVSFAPGVVIGGEDEGGDLGGEGAVEIEAFHFGPGELGAFGFVVVAMGVVDDVVVEEGELGGGGAFLM